ncbi:MAG: WYL domain-containing protein [Bacteroidales bacterium]|nr:WYL domain-containing protein [Bacteroidales bacterium]
MKSKYFLRYQFIIEKLQRVKAIYEEIEQFLTDKFEMLGYEFNYSLRTFQRDKNDIENIFGIEIKYDRSEKVYFINENEMSESAKILSDAFTLSASLQLYDNFSEFISLEKNNFGKRGMFYDIAEAVKNQNLIKLWYQKFYEKEHTEYRLEPLALKEFEKRWYLIARKMPAAELRTFSFDRIIHYEILKSKFKERNFNLTEYFKNFYGIITDETTPFEEVILSFDAFQGNYIKSLPLHGSQEIIKNTEDELVIKLKLHITFDFKQKLLSFGSSMKVLKPDFLRDKIKNEFLKAIDEY